MAPYDVRARMAARSTPAPGSSDRPSSLRTRPWSDWRSRYAAVPVGMPTLGGTLATQGGLVFIAGTQDYYLRAFDSATGKEVWKARLPVGSQGGPMSYVSPRTGKQYVLISAGGARQSPDRGDYVIAYALKR